MATTSPTLLQPGNVWTMNAPVPDSVQAPGTRHMPELDALRGLAAIVVVLNHGQQVCIAAGAPAWLAHPRHNPLVWLLVNGHASVILFFLLSGFVLTLPRLRGPAQPYTQFVLRRFVRIYPPYLAALAVAVFACGALSGRPSYGDFAAVHWPRVPDAASLLQHVFMLARFDIFRYDGPVWSLVHEARISLLFPLIAFAAMRLRAFATLGVALGCAVLSSFSMVYLEGGLSGQVQMTAWSLTLGYCGIFLLGSALARRHQACAQLLDRLPRVGRATLGIAALVLYLYPGATWGALNLADFWIACAGLVLLAFCLRRQGLPARLLRMRPMQWIGKVSYSLYLVHLPVLLVLSTVCYGRVPLPAVMALYAVFSLLFAVALHHLVEVPCIALGRRIGRVSPASFPRHSNLVSWPSRSVARASGTLRAGLR